MNGGVIISDGAPEDVISREMIEAVYNIKADIIMHDSHRRCVPIFERKREVI